MAIYLAKMCMHDYYLSQKLPSLLAIGCVYVSLKICEQLKKNDFITTEVVQSILEVSQVPEEEILKISQKILYLAQNFDKVYPGLINLKETHFSVITKLL
jgi:cyclin B/cyclin A